MQYLTENSSRNSEKEMTMTYCLLLPAIIVYCECVLNLCNSLGLSNRRQIDDIVSYFLPENRS